MLHARESSIFISGLCEIDNNKNSIYYTKEHLLYYQIHLNCVMPVYIKYTFPKLLPKLKNQRN